MPCVHVAGAILNMAGPTRIIEAGGKTFYFEFHSYLGPLMNNKHGEAIQSMPPKKSPFWDALYWWIKQGKRMDGNRCVFEWEMKLVYITERVGKRTEVILTGHESPSQRELLKKIRLARVSSEKYEFPERI